jgi:hypothetical protein
MAALTPQWQPTVSGNAELDLSTISAGNVPALRMDFDFKGGKGFVVARREFKRAMPSDYAVRFRLRGSGPLNDLELKLIDDTGLNVWRHVYKDLRLPARWKRIELESRDIEFAWGPSSGRGISQLGYIELAIVAGAGGKGTMWIADLEIEDLTPAQAPTAQASSELPGFEAGAALLARGWKPRLDDPRPWIVIDSGEPRALGGLIIDWQDAAPASGFRIRASNTGHRWKIAHSAERAGGKRSYVYLPGLKARFLRLDLKEPSAGAALRLQSFEFSRSIDAFWYAIAAAEARASHPRWLHREQTEWTPIGTSHGLQCALMNTDGMVEVSPGSFSIEPMLSIEERLVTWADVSARQELKERWMPVPSSIWETQDWRLSIQAECSAGGELRLTYRFENRTARGLRARLLLLLRPFQVTPPWQHFGDFGGVSRIHDLVWRERALHINDSTLIVPLTEPTGFGAMSFDEGCIVSLLQSGQLPMSTELHDPFGFAAGALAFELSTPPHETCERALRCRPVDGAPSTAEPAFDWAGELRTNLWDGHGWAAEAIRAALTATAHVLVTRRGPALQPGPRRYTRSWIRDGAMMSAALLRMGHVREVGDFIRWYAPHQRADGFVPCCVDQHGPDWLVEHDSHGQLIALIRDHHRFASDVEFLKDVWSFVEKAAACIEKLMGPDGLLPVSVSHEGYLAQPVHSYWDDFWALRGLGDAADLALVLREQALAERWASLARRLAGSLFASIESTRSRRRLDFIPGSVEWADFDPTATANAIYLHDVPAGLDRAAVERTFDLYLADWRAKRSGAVLYSNYTPYEIRIIGALVRLGRREAALELLRFFLSDRRPVPWNQWPEIAWRDHETPAHVGDLPHTWISAEFVLAVRCMFAYERESDRTLILAAGLAPEWLEGAGVRVERMPTLYGALSYSLRKLDSRTVQFDVRSAPDVPLLLRPPLGCRSCGVTLDGKPLSSAEAESVTIRHAPAEVIFTAH